MLHIILGSTGRLAMELILHLNNIGKELLLVSSKNKDSINLLRCTLNDPCILYDFMSASRPGFTGDKSLEDEIRDLALAIPLRMIEKYIYISTAGELYKSKGVIIRSDDWRKLPEIGEYAKRKLEVENLLLTALGKKVRIIRVTNIYGGRFKSKGLGVVDNWLASFNEGKRPYISTEIDTFRNYIHIDCVIDEITSQIEKSSLIILDTMDYFFLSEVYKMIFNEKLSLNIAEKEFDLSLVAKRKKSNLQDFIKANKKS